MASNTLSKSEISCSLYQNIFEYRIQRHLRDLYIFIEKDNLIGKNFNFIKIQKVMRFCRVPCIRKGL